MEFYFVADVYVVDAECCKSDMKIRAVFFFGKSFNKIQSTMVLTNTDSVH